MVHVCALLIEVLAGIERGGRCPEYSLASLGEMQVGRQGFDLSCRLETLRCKMVVDLLPVEIGEDATDEQGNQK